MAELRPGKNIQLIALRPAGNCDPAYVKVLKPGEIYRFCNEYEIDPETDQLTFHPLLPRNLYKTGKINVQVSAIAGPNGSGKSSLVELLLMALNNIAFVKGGNTGMNLVDGLSVALYIKLHRYCKLTINGSQLGIQYYSRDGLLSGPEEVPDLAELFYTIVVNYSLYAYNTRDIKKGQKDWLTGLFHKNDAYQTPLVINPFRDAGIIDINTENVLVRQRLIANLLRADNGVNGFNFRKLTEQLTATKLRLAQNLRKSKHVLYERDQSDKKKMNLRVKVYLDDLQKIDRGEVLKKINNHFPFQRKTEFTGIELHATDYLVGKLVSIAATYQEYIDKKYYSEEDENFDMDKLDDYIVDLLDDPSHIAFKFKQTLNFLKYDHIPRDGGDLDLSKLSKDIAVRISKIRTDKPRLIDMLPPPVFNTDILLKTDGIVANNADKDGLIEFKDLSSGEKQMVYSASSILYHLININSVRSSPTKKKYRLIHVIFEEIELYFHPEMQRKFVSYLLDSIRNTTLTGIDGIHFCFVTHSPFILSDIPGEHVLFLKVDEQERRALPLVRQTKSFGANIHELLADGFFMENGFSGEYAKNKINETINFLEYNLIAGRLKALFSQSDKNAGRSLVENETEKEIAALSQQQKELEGRFTEKKKEEHLRLIESIGEPVLKTKLLEMYDEAFNYSRRAQLLVQIARLKKQLTQLDS
jgi:energy-coupling factor transporter ATP-binding protein EcfA2